MPHRNDMSVWSGRVDAADRAAGRRWHQVVRPADASEGPGVALAGFACDAGVRRNHGRPGAVAGPHELRRMLGNLAWHGGDEQRLYDAGDVACEGDALEAAQTEYADLVAGLLRRGHFPVGLGGGHEIAWASYQGAERALAGDPRLHRLGIINFDAHLDLRRPEIAGRGTSGTPFLQIAESRAAAGMDFRYLCVGASAASNTAALFERADALGAGVVLDVDTGGSEAEARIRRFVEESSVIYLTFCLDALPPAVAPGVSAPSALGVPLHHAIALLRGLLAACGHGTPGGKLLLADVAELNPTHDEAGRTARTAARIVYEIASISR
jgi:formiminoglutamase